MDRETHIVIHRRNDTYLSISNISRPLFQCTECRESSVSALCLFFSFNVLCSVTVHLYGEMVKLINDSLILNVRVSVLSSVLAVLSFDFCLFASLLVFLIDNLYRVLCHQSKEEKKERRPRWCCALLINPKMSAVWCRVSWKMSPNSYRCQ